MGNIFQRNISMDSIKDIDMSEYDPKELVAFLTTAYPSDPKGALEFMRENFRVSPRVGEQAELILEGLCRAETK